MQQFLECDVAQRFQTQYALRFSLSLSLCPAQLLEMLFIAEIKPDKKAYKHTKASYVRYACFLQNFDIYAHHIRSRQDLSRMNEPSITDVPD